MPFDPATLAVAANAGQVASAAYPVMGLVAKAVTDNPQYPNRKEIVLDVAKTRIDSAMSELTKFSQFAPVSPDIENQYKLFENEFLQLNKRFEASTARATLLKERTWRERVTWTALKSSLDPSPSKDIEKISRQMQNLTFRMTSASAEAESTYKQVAKKVQLGLTHELDIKMFQLYAEKDPAMSTGEFVGTTVRQAAMLALPPIAVDIYLNLFIDKLNAINLPGSQASTPQTASFTTAQSPISTQSISTFDDTASRTTESSSNSDPFVDPSGVNTENIAMVDLSGTGEATIRERTPRRRMSTADMV